MPRTRVIRRLRSTVVPLFALAALVTCVLPSPLAAQEIQRGKLTYVTSTTAYVDLGSLLGFDVGDTLRVSKNGTVSAVLVVTHIASKSMATRIVSKSAPLAEGDAVSGIPKNPPRPQQVVVQHDSTSQPPRPPAPAVPVPAAVHAAPAPSDETTVHGRVSLQFYGLTSSTTAGFDFSQPALAFNVTAAHLLALPLQFTLYSNHRYDARSASRYPATGTSRLSNRVYQASLEYGGPNAPFGAEIGRFIVPAVGGVGTFDGALVVSRSGPWEAGLVAGTQPGYTQSEVSLHDPKFAAYAAYTTGEWQNTRYQGSAAFAQTYRNGALDRGFFSLQNMLSMGSTLSFYQNANIDVYDLRGGAAVASVHVSDLFLSTAYRPLRWLSWNGSYALRRNVYYLRSFGSLPDSLFDRSLQHNVSVSAGVNLPLAMFVSATGSLRLSGGAARNAPSMMLRYTWANALQTGTSFTLLGTIADNVYNRTRNIGLELSRDILTDLFATVRLQRFEYSFNSGNRTLARNAAGLDLFFRVSRMFTASFSGERAWEGAIITNRFYLDVSARF